jgi:hypothetical protein
MSNKRIFTTIQEQRHHEINEAFQNLESACNKHGFTIDKIKIVKQETNNKMSNNKLYTEEQLRASMLSMKTYIEMYDKSVIDKIVENHIKALGGVELPTDEEISEVAMVVYGFNARDIKDVLEYKAFKRGAKYVINKIQGGNK